MAVTQYDYAINDTLNNAVDLEKLGDEIDADATVSVNQDHINTDSADPAASGSLEIHMADALTAPQKTALDAVVAAHDGVPYVRGDVLPTVDPDNPQDGEQWIDPTLGVHKRQLSGSASTLPRSTISFAIVKDETTGWLPIKNTGYTKVVSFIFDGSDSMGTPTSAKLVIWVSSPTADCDVRIYDITNSQVICEKLNITNEDEQIVDLGALSNIPTGPAIWELQGKRGGGEGRTSYVQVAF